MTTALEEFKKICAVPRRSYHNEKIVDYCIGRAKELGLSWYYDEKNVNVVIRKEAAKGKEDRPGIVLQGHLDMVAQQDPKVEHDWENEGLELIENGDILTAKGTTLGADDGVAAAIAFALLQDETLQNPPIEVLLTTNEEVGMDSVRDADLSYLNGKYLFNLDSGREGEFVTGCCGGKSIKAVIPLEKEETDGAAYSVKVTGLKGGHSGIEIGTERANALKVLGQVFYDLGKKYDFRITDLTAEGKDNAISKEASSDFVITTEHVTTDIAVAVKETETMLRKIFRKSDPDLKIEVTTRGNCRCKAETRSLNEKASRGLAFLLQQLPFGVLYHDQSMDGSIETSCNIGLVEKTEDTIGIVLSIRSSVEERIEEITGRIDSLCQLAGATLTQGQKAYPSWLPDPDSPLIGLFRDIFVRIYGKEPKIGPVHAGLECGYILSNSGIEAALATGPSISGEHTTDEALSISSLQRTYEFIKTVIECV